jgi:hypothetical protein
VTSLKKRRASAGSVAAALLAAAIVSLAAAAAQAEIRRVAVVVGSNHGDAGHAPLRFAEQDAIKLSAVLGELGGLAPADLLLLRGPSLAEVRAALDEASRRVAAWHTGHHGQAVLLFYFSGHSNGEVLELGTESLPFSELRRRIGASGADVRLVIVDSCRSGALLALKGGTLGQPFDIRMADDLGSTGEAFIASSAADEAALESAEIGASFFSHHFVSGLRGAADLSGDGLVTLAEAYQYAFARTLRATSDTIVGPQHPAYDYHLAGRGELVLTELRHPSAALDLPAGFDRLLLVATAREQVVAEIGARSAHRIAVAPGVYHLRAWRGARTFTTRIELAQGQERKIASADLLPVDAAGALAAKGDETVIATHARPARRSPPASSSPGWAASAAVGIDGGISDGALLKIGRVAVERRGDWQRLSLALAGGTGRTDRMRENRVGAELLESWWTTNRIINVGAGLGLGSGVAFERTDAGATHWSGLAWASLAVRLEVALTRDTALELAGTLPVTLLRRDGAAAVILLPAAWLGVARAF